MSAPFYSPTEMHQDISAHNPPGFVTEPDLITTYQDTEPVPVSTYQPNESDQQEKDDDFWEHGFNREEEPVEEEPEQPRFQAANENGKRTVDNSSSAHGDETDLSQLPAIAPFSSGQGLPYAPVDWPSPGDVWKWRVGRRVTSVGYHQDRFLILPDRLRYKNAPKSFAGKNTLVRYIQTNFPGMDTDSLFASFNWRIPALFQPSNQVDAASLFEETPREVQTEAAPDGKKDGNSRYSQRKRKPMPTQINDEPVEEKPKANPRGGSSRNKKKKGAATPATGPKSSRQSVRRSSSQQRGGAVDLNFLDEEETEPAFDTYLNTLDNILHQGQEDAGRDSSSSFLVSASSPMREYEWAEARMKISSLLEKDFPTLFVSKEAAEISALATKLRKDPNLTAEEIVRLKLIEEIPMFSEVFRENKTVIEEADRFFSALELNKAKVASLKYEYSDLKQKLGDIQMEVDANAETIRQIDEQIGQLQARRSEVKRYIGNKEKEKVDLSYGQKMVANSIPKVVQEVQSANSKKPEWECKKENALKRETEIMSKFIPLKGFFL
ncbi:unnamed protein product [Cochlearia groenlandica]